MAVCVSGRYAKGVKGWRGGLRDESLRVLLDDTRQYFAKRDRWRGVCVKHAAGAFLPICHRSVDSLLNVRAIEVDPGRRFVAERAWEAHHVLS